ncbi:uncharacterized protein LOC126678260 [Mercurialis annua]|uniref:uncharacterized protein LOC126678260 n=1 Tax=Mercurialis annua TaxID=3986 RepID=UPI002160DEB1|nr:uncharacterized protein LOC126678260 [Mercurialis annua]
MICVRTPKYSVSINGSLYGYFKGGRGLRQGDPLSPTLFVIVMDYLSRHLSEIGSRVLFKHHRGCKTVKLNHLSFAGDLLLFCHGDLDSAKCLKDGLNHFQEVSGLSVNKDKSSIFFCNVPDDQKRNILDYMEFGEGYLPVKYLGMALISRRLTKEDCQVVILKITSRITSWNMKYLSYTGSSSGRKYGGIAWETVCQKKKSGGLGIKKVDLWNTAAVMKQVWIMLTNKCSLWPHWVIQNKLKKLSYLGITKPYKASWSWRNLVKLRSLAKDLFEYIVGNGRDTYFWFDPWVHGKSVLDTFPGISTKDADIPKDARTSDLIKNGNRILPDAADEVTLHVCEFIRNIFATNRQGNDKVMVLKKEFFTIKAAWNFLFLDSQMVSWSSLLWKGPSIPRYSSITWIAIQKGLNTRDKLFRWGSVNSPCCVLCNNEVETVSHLFFSSNFSDVVWRGVLRGCGILRSPLRWSREISWFARKFKGRSVSNRLCRLAFCAAVYFIWMERNNAIFKGCRPKDSDVIKKVRFAVCYCLNCPSDRSDLEVMQERVHLSSLGVISSWEYENSLVSYILVRLSVWWYDIIMRLLEDKQKRLPDIGMGQGRTTKQKERISAKIQRGFGGFSLFVILVFLFCLGLLLSLCPPASCGDFFFNGAPMMI